MCLIMPPRVPTPYARPLTVGQRPPLVAPHYQVSYQLKRASMYLGCVQSTFLVLCTRRFPTNELNVILADLYVEVGPAHDLLGIEILTIRSLLG